MVAPAITDTTADPSYKEWFKFKVKIRDRQGDLLYVIDQFEDAEYNQGLNLFHVDATTGSFQTGFFNLGFYDNERIVDVTKVGLGNIVEIEASKRQDTFKHIMYGFCREIEPTRPGGDILRYRMSGFGSGIILRELLINIEKKAKLFDIEEGSVTDPRDSATQAGVLVEDILTNPDYMVYNNGADSLQELIGCTVNGIDPQVVDTVPYLVALNGVADNVIATICETVGVIAGLDAENDFYLRYPTTVHSGVTLKVLQKGEMYNAQDSARYTAYVIGPYAAPISIKVEDGFANIVRSTALTNRQFLSGSAISDGFKTLWNQALAQRFIPGSLGFKGLALMLSKIGTIKDKKLRGSILAENKTLISPSLVQVATFHFPVSEISEETPQPVEELSMTIINKNFDPLANHWIVLWIREGDENNTLRWHHNNDFNTPEQWSAIAQGTSQDTTNPPWEMFPSGPMFSYAAFQSKRHEVIASDPFSVDRYGPIMMDVPNDFIDDNFTMNKYVNTQLSIASVPQIRYTPMSVRIPNDMVFKENTQVTFLDAKIGATNLVSRQAGIQQVSWNWDWYTHGRPGIKTCELTILGYYDWYVESEPMTVCEALV